VRLMAGCGTCLRVIGGVALAFALGETAAQTNSLARQAALDTNSLSTGLSQPPSDFGVSGAGGITPVLRDPVTAVPRSNGPARPERQVRGNPLWVIPLTSLNATRERPIFLPSRRAPAPVVAAAPPPPTPAPTPPPAEPERPRLTLLGAVIGDVEAIAIFFDQGTRAIVRLRTGEDYSGWVLRSVKGREATLQKGRETVLLALPRPGEQSGLQADPQPIPPALPGAPVLGVPSRSSVGPPVAPTVRGPAPLSREPLPVPAPPQRPPV
jgi:general secretion pathway protein N